MVNLTGRSILVTGAAYRLGRVIAIAVAKAGADVIIHHGHSEVEAEETAMQVREFGRKAWVIKADFSDHNQVQALIPQLAIESPLYGLVNSAAIFPPGGMMETSLDVWQENLTVNLTAPFLLSQSFIRLLGTEKQGRIINLIDWRALRPGKDHFAYTISKAGLAAFTRAAALAAAPNITVNAIALGAILPPNDGSEENSNIIRPVPAKRWASLSELEELITFLLTGPEYITGEIIHLDGGRHLV